MRPKIPHGCRLENHNLSAQRIEAEDNDKTISNQCAFLVTCHDCNCEWKETWTRSAWFLRDSFMIIKILS